MTWKRLALALLVAVMGFFWFTLYHPSRIKSVSPRLLVTTQDWHLDYSDAPYLWLSPYEAFHFEGDSIRGYRAATFDTVTKSQTLEPFLGRMQPAHLISVSPDGQWLLWDSFNYNGRGTFTAATRRADGKTLRWPGVQISWSRGFWMPDSRHWTGIIFVPTGNKLRGLPVARRKIAVYSLDTLGCQSYPMPVAHPTGELLGVTAQGHLMFSDASSLAGGPPGTLQPPISLTEVTLGAPQSASRSFQASLPPHLGEDSSTVLLSPRGDRLLWTCVTSKPTRLPDWFDGLTHYRYGHSTESLDVWVCSLGGSQPRHLESWIGPHVGECGWNPDGTHFSFVADDALYSVAVD